MKIGNGIAGGLILSLSLAAACGPAPGTGAPGSGGSGGGGGTGSGTGTDTGTGSDGSCPLAKSFPAVSADAANSAYPAPTLSVSCDAQTVTVKSNGIPGYRYVQQTPNPLKAQSWAWRFPRNPVEAAKPSTIPLLGPVGVAVNGLPIYGPNEGTMPHPYGDPVYNKMMDYCMGHTAQAGDYHYHALLVKCLIKDAVDGQPSPIVGYGFDGFPVYGPYECADDKCSRLVKMQSSWDRTGDPTTYAWDNYTYKAKAGEGYLDKCNGHVGVDGSYHYHATETFPYVFGCYAGTATQNGGGRQ